MKKNTYLKLLVVFVVVFGLFVVAKEKLEENNTPTLKDADIIYDEKFGGFFLDLSIEEFNELGFEYGDSVDLTLSNGVSLTDIPYYNGYYTKTGEVLICAYPGYAHPKVQENNGSDLYKKFELDGSETASVTLNASSKYIDVQNALNTVYKNEREAFESDETFANYRMMKGGNLKEGVFYRSASPVDNEYNRAVYANDLMENDGVKLVLDLSDSEEDLLGYIEQDDFKSDYAKSLYENGKIILLDMGSSYRGDAYKEKVVCGLKEVINNDGPYLIHCVEGKDRTGFVAILIEALCNATYEEMLTDYMITYDNYYGINANNHKEQYDAIVDVKFNDMFDYLNGLDGTTISDKATNYLLSGGMTLDEVNTLITKLSK